MKFSALQLHLMPPRDYGQCRPERPSGCTRDITKRQSAVPYMTGLNQLPHEHRVTLDSVHNSDRLDSSIVVIEHVATVVTVLKPYLGFRAKLLFAF
jgi:hypothetical protein